MGASCKMSILSRRVALALCLVTIIAIVQLQTCRACAVDPNINRTSNTLQNDASRKLDQVQKYVLGKIQTAEEAQRKVLVDILQMVL